MPAGRVVFIVDRDLAVRESLRFTIELDGMKVNTCSSGQELLAHPELAEGACAIVDGKTLHGAGPEVGEGLLAVCEILPIILIADHVSRRLLARMISSGFFHLVDQPVLDDALLRCVRAVRRV
jgi:FixJ family two-component response regulator